MSKLEVVGRQSITAGEVGEFRLRITVGEAGIAPGGGFVVYPPITTVPHLWSMVRWQLGGVVVADDPEKQWEAWISRLDRDMFSESNVNVVRLLNHGGFAPAGSQIELILLDSVAQEFAMEGSWFYLEEDPAGLGASAFTGVADYEAPRHVAWGEQSTASQSERSAKVDVNAARAEKLVAVLSSKPQDDGTVTLSVRAEDKFGNLASLDEPIEIVPENPYITFAPSVGLTNGAARGVPGTVLGDGVMRVEVRAPRAGLAAVSSPSTTDLTRRLYFGDLHGHTSLSDGLNSGDYYFRHARDEAFLDFVALTDHYRFDQVIIDLTDKHHDDGEFVTFYGREWGDEHGHRNIYSLDWRELAAFDHTNFWQELPNRDVLMIPHHTNASTKFHWKHCDFSVHDPERERLIEVVQNRGSFEQEEIGGPILDGGYVSSVYSALCMGRRFGFVGGTDTHRGHPGGPSHPLHPYYHRWKPFHGLTVIAARSCTREALWDALWKRRTYCTTGARILVDFFANGQPMGSVLKCADSLEIKATVCGTAPIESIDIISRNGVESSKSFGRMDVEFILDIPEPKGFYYMRVRQEDGHFAYISPVWCE